MSDTKTFHLGDVLSVIGERLVSPDGIDGVYRVMNHLTGHSLFTHQLVVYRDECKAEIFRQHPELKEIDDSSVTRDNWESWLAQQVTKYGEKIELQPISPDAVRVDDPFTDFAKLGVPDEKIIAVKAD